MLRTTADRSFPGSGLLAWLAVDIRLWLAERGLWWATSVVVHALILSTALLIMGRLVVEPKLATERVVFNAAVEDLPQSEPLEHFEPSMFELPRDPLIDLTVIAPPPGDTVTAVESAAGPGEGGLDQGWGDGSVEIDVRSPALNPRTPGFEGAGPGPKRNGAPGILGGRGPGGGRVLGITGATQQTNLAVARALRWIARHQNSDGSWSVDNFHARCSDDSCRGQGSIKADGAATALGILPLLAAGQTHRPQPRKNADSRHVDYHEHVARAVYWLHSHQQTNGDLSAGSEQVMYSHGMATIALAELYALTGDKAVGADAQRAVNFIVAAQHPATGGWRYKPGEKGDTSVAGWQIMALKSAQIAGLEVPSKSIELAHRWLAATSVDESGQFSYEPGGGVSPTMTAVGLLAKQYLGVGLRSAAMRNGARYLMAQLPAADAPNAYYWYYGTQVLHNLQGSDWETWNRRTREILTKSEAQTAGLCSQGSWDPARPLKDAWGEQGGRLMVTSLNCLTLQVYYRYLPLYKLDGADPPRAGE